MAQICAVGPKELTGSRGSVVSALDFQSLILSLIPGENRSFLLSLHPLTPEPSNITFITVLYIPTKKELYNFYLITW